MPNLRILSVLLTLLVCSTDLYTQCAVDGSVNILPATIIQSRAIELEVAGLVDDDLSGTQKLCNVFMEFEHGRIENVKITLTSPAGQTITLIGPSVTGGGLSPLVRWNIIMGQCANPTNPFGGLDPVWNNAQTWAAFTEYTGTYHPQQGCLEDFNMGSANGTWTIDIENLGNTSGMLTYFAIQFCDGNPGDCTSCSPYAGSLGNQPIAFCEGTEYSGVLQFELLPEVGSQDSLIYFYEEPSGATFFSGQFTNLASLDAGEITICVLVADESTIPQVVGLDSVADLEALADQPGVCMDFGDCIIVSVLPFAESRVVNRTICLGDTIMFQGEVYDTEIDTLFVDGTPIQPCRLQQQLILEVVDVRADISGPSTPLVCGEVGFLDGTASDASSGPIIDYIWTTDSGNFVSNFGPIAQVDAAGTYYLEAVTESGGVQCSARDTITVTAVNDFMAAAEQVPFVCPEDNELIIIVQDTSAQNPATLSVLAVQGPQGSNNVIDGDSVTVDIAGTYTVTVGAGACMMDLIVTVEENDLMETPLTISTSNVITCAEDSTTLMTSAVGAGLTYEWATPFGFSSDEESPVIREAALYFVTVTDTNGCTQTASEFIDSDADFPENSVDQLTFDCAPAEQRRLRVNIDQPVDSVRWSGPNGFSSTEEEPFYLEEGTYELTMYGSNGCVSTETVVVTADFSSGLSTMLNFIFPWNEPDCVQGQTTVCWENIWATYDSSLQFSWTNSIGVELSVDSCLTVTEADVYTLSMKNRDGCTGERTVELAPIVASIMATPDQLGCGVDSLSLDSSAELFGSNQSLSWSLEGVSLPQFDGEPIINISAPGTYIFEITDELIGCTFSDTILIETLSSEIPGLDVSSEAGVCEGPALLAVPTSSALDSLFINGSSVPLQSIYELPADTYTLVGYDRNGCSVDTTIILNSDQGVTVDLGPDLTVVAGSTVELTTEITGAVSGYIWTAASPLDCQDCPINNLVATMSDEVFISVVSEDGCTAMDTLLLTVLQDTVDTEVVEDKPFYIPTHFQPGLVGEGSFILGLDTTRVEQYLFRVYDRWGNLIVEKTALADSSTVDIWDGTRDGKPLISGVYVYMAEFLYTDSIEEVVSGTITLLK